MCAVWGGKGATHGNVAGIKSSWKQLLKRGLNDPKARSYFYKNAHNSVGKYVFNDLLKSSGKNAVGSIVIMGKNYLREVSK